MAVDHSLILIFRIIRCSCDNKAVLLVQGTIAITHEQDAISLYEDQEGTVSCQ